ncbi:MAG: PAS domain S-box protein, partial [Proteobacteria bacterium]
MPPEFVPSSTLFQAAVENSYDVIEMVRDDGTILYVNPSVTRVLGYQPQDLIGTNALDLVHDDDRPQISQELRDLLQSQTTEISAYRCRDINNGWHWIKSTGSVLDAQSRTLVLSSRDITPQKAGELLSASNVVEDPTKHQEAQRAQFYFRSIVQSSDDAIIGVTVEGIVTSWNSGAERMLGYTEPEMLGRPFKILVPVANQIEAERLKLDQISSGQNRVIEKPLMHKDGSEVDASIHSTLVRSEAGELLGVFVVARDITLQKQADAERERFFSLSLDLL